MIPEKPLEIAEGYIFGLVPVVMMNSNLREWLHCARVHVRK